MAKSFAWRDVGQRFREGATRFPFLRLSISSVVGLAEAYLQHRDLAGCGCYRIGSSPVFWNYWMFDERRQRLILHERHGRTKVTDSTGERDLVAEKHKFNREASDGAELFKAISNDAGYLLSSGKSELSGRLGKFEPLSDHSRWITLLLVVAWECREGSILRADRSLPLVSRVYKLARERGIKENDWDNLEALEKEVADSFDEEDFVSILPIDPFLASVELIRILKLAPDKPDSKPDRKKNLVPQNPLVTKLINELSIKLGQPAYPNKIDVAKELVEREIPNVPRDKVEKTAENLIRQTLRFPHLFATQDTGQ